MRDEDHDGAPPLDEDPVVVEFPDVGEPPRRETDGAARESQRRRDPLGMLFALLLPAAMLAGACLPLLFVLRRPAGLAGWVGGVALTAVLLWIVVSVLWPARADRRCPECGADELRRLDPNTTHGVRCSSCGWEDPTRSAWLLAEEEGRPLEHAVMRERGRRLPADGHDSDVDTTGAND